MRVVEKVQTDVAIAAFMTSSQRPDWRNLVARFGESGFDGFRLYINYVSVMGRRSSSQWPQRSAGRPASPADSSALCGRLGCRAMDHQASRYRDRWYGVSAESTRPRGRYPV